MSANCVIAEWSEARQKEILHYSQVFAFQSLFPTGNSEMQIGMSKLHRNTIISMHHTELGATLDLITSPI